MESVKFGVWIGECEVWSVQCGVWSGEFEMWNVRCGVESVKLWVERVKWRV